MDSEIGPIGDAFVFSEKSVRRGFIRKVYAILSLQLLVTFGIVAIFTYIPTIQNTLQDHPSMFWVPFTISIVVLLVLICAGDLRRKTPFNFIFLIIFTICEGVVIGCICAMYDAWEVSIAVVATLVVAASLTLFAFQTKIDFTMHAGAILCLSMVLIVFGIFSLIFRSNVLNIFYACIGAFVFSIYLVFDTQLILGGKHKMSISPEEYVFAALNLYLDIINLFLMLLYCFGGRG